YTLISCFRLLWAPSGCPDNLTPFIVSDKCVFWHFNYTSGSSRIFSSACQKDPLNALHFCLQLNK
ncbi:hypothetical protein METBIDRAFT_34440, partial [Metschnikowia bicuspidata var. bicuspidata NRRL YB-4993]